MSDVAWDERSRRVWRRHLIVIRSSDRELASILLEAAKEAERVAASIVGDVGIGAQVRRAQYQIQAHALRQVHAELWGELRTGLQGRLAETARLGTEAGDLLSTLMGGASGFDDYVAAARFSADQVVSRVLNDIPLSRRVFQSAAWSGQKLNAVINSGIGAGKSAREIAKDVYRFISPRTPGGASYAARRLARTELNNAFHRSTIDMSKDQPWVTGMAWRVSGSHPRPDICDEMAAEGPYAPGKTPSKPHPQCLCYLVPVTPSRQEFMNNLVNGSYDKYLRRAA